MIQENTKLRTLGTFLKSRRNQLQPEQAGFSHSYGQRRTPGLRREEVAVLAGVSATYYTWLEQGRDVTASRDVIENIARALQLNPDERVHLLQLWNPNEPETIANVSTISPHWQHILNQLHSPSIITNHMSEFIFWNLAANELFSNLDAMLPEERFFMRLVFLNEEFRSRIVNLEEYTISCVAVYRSYYNRHPENLFFREFVQRLCMDSPEFEAIWNLHHVQLQKACLLHIHMPSAQQIVTFDSNSMATLDNSPNYHMCIYSPVSS